MAPPWRITRWLACALSKSFWRAAVRLPARNGTVDVSWLTNTVAAFLPLSITRFRPGSTQPIAADHVADRDDRLDLRPGGASGPGSIAGCLVLKPFCGSPPLTGTASTPNDRAANIPAVRTTMAREREMVRGLASVRCIRSPSIHAATIAVSGARLGRRGHAGAGPTRPHPTALGSRR